MRSKAKPAPAPAPAKKQAIGVLDWTRPADRLPDGTVEKVLIWNKETGLDVARRFDGSILPEMKGWNFLIHPNEFRTTHWCLIPPGFRPD